MIRFTALNLQKIGKQHGYHLKAALKKTVAFEKAKRQIGHKIDGERVAGRGAQRRKQTSELKEEMGKMEHPAIWIWYPWRKNPEPPTPAMPITRALKNPQGAIYTELTPVQKRRSDEMYYGLGKMSVENDKAYRDQKHENNHPFLHTVLQSLEGKAKGFPFWYKKYPTRRHAFLNRFSIPNEMLEGYSDTIKKSLSVPMMTLKEKLSSQKSMYIERYAQHDFDINSIPVRCVVKCVKARELRSHLLTNPHNHVAKRHLATTERKIGSLLRIIRKTNFRIYWSILRDHDVQDLIQPTNNISYRMGSYWQHDWNQGLAIKTNIADFMDPRGLNGCIETGRSRAEVARDLGLSYTRALADNEKRALSHQSTYYEKLAKFRATNPEQSREMDRIRYLKKFSGMFALMNKKAAVIDFPSKYRRLIGSKFTRWKSARHGPM
eukprot:Tbor_TRINITY_DN5102_c1_g3::TRINITY_DN5102_c1_g3_i1::g.26332::m.26332